MEPIKQNTEQIAWQIANKLDELDGTDFYITKDTWKKCFNAKEKGIKRFHKEKISIFKARKLIKESLDKLNENQNDLGQKWLNSLSENSEDLAYKNNKTKKKDVPEAKNNTNAQQNILTKTAEEAKKFVRYTIPVIENFAAIKPKTIETFSSSNNELDDSLNLISVPDNLEEIAKTNSVKAEDDTKPEVTIAQNPKDKEATIKTMANSWYRKYHPKNCSIEEFTQFVRDCYEAAKELNITNVAFPNNSGNYQTKEDQIVDEMLACFASESAFQKNATSKDGLYHGIFQFSAIAMKELENNKSCYLKEKNLAPLTMSEFKKKDLSTQLKYMVQYVKCCKKYYTKSLENKPISAAQMYAMWWLPACGDNSSKVNKQSNKMMAKMKERGQVVYTA